jgi:hypothetical protein
MIDQINHTLSELARLFGDADRLLDQYVGHVRERDGLNLPLPAIRLTHVDTRAGLSLDVCRALELAKADLEGVKVAAANSAPISSETLFDPETTGITDDLTVAEGARLLKQQRRK